ncbi:MAG TPA: hypothetical protein VFC21_08195 [Bryobacteraceae bacterium]|nr:hypothetical protein [Bryobacteraceae bacterium]
MIAAANKSAPLPAPSVAVARGGPAPAVNAQPVASAFAALVEELSGAAEPPVAKLAVPVTTAVPVPPKPEQMQAPDGQPEAPAPQQPAPVQAPDGQTQASAPQPAVPVDSKPVRGRGMPEPAPAAERKALPEFQIPFLSVTVPVPPAPLPSLKPAAAAGSRPEERASAAIKADDPAPPETMAVNDAALVVRLRTPHDAATPAAPAPEASKAASPVAAVAPKTVDDPQPSPVVVREISELPRVTEPLAAAAPAALPATPPVPVHTTTEVAAVRTPEAAARPAHESATPTRATYIEEPPEVRQAPQQPIRSVSLEFSPDGASDVRLRLSEKGGEVHISLHSSDTSLTSRLHEGVHDLVGSLSSAGYEADAWTPNQGGQNGQREPEQRRNRRTVHNESGEDFSDALQQPIQEVS